MLVSLAIICSFLGSGVSIGTVLGFAVLPVRVIGIICAIRIILTLLSDRSCRLKIQYIVVSYIYMLIVTLLFSENYLNSFSLLLDYLCVISIFCVIVLNTINEDSYTKYSYLFLVCTLITIAICFYEYITLHHVANNYTQAYSMSDWAYSYTIKAPTAFLYNPNNVAVLMIIALPLILEKTKERCTSIKRIGWFVLVILDIAVVFMTGSRGGLVAGAAVLGIYFVASDIKLWKKLIVLIVVFAVVIYFSNFILDQMEYGGMLENGKINLFADGDGGRSSIAKAALENVFTNNLLFGSGASALENRGGMSAHNTIIEVLCNYGVFGTVIFIILIVRLLKRLLSQNNRIISILLALAFFMSMFIPPTIMTLSVLFIPLALRVGRSYIEKESSYEKSSIN